MKKLNGIIVLLLAGAVPYLALKTSPIDPLIWDAPAAPQTTGILESSDTLMKVELFGQDQLHDPEGTIMDSQGRVYADPVGGRVVRLDASGKVETFVDTDGCPLGMDPDVTSNLVLADAWKGLLRIDPQDKVEALIAEADGVLFAFTDDLDITSDSRVYFGDASSEFRRSDCIPDLLEVRPHGRLLRYDPPTGETGVLLKDLYFTNDMAFSANGGFILVNEIYRYHITRYWLKGGGASQHEVLTDNLPSLPDNLQGDHKGAFWVALSVPRRTDVDFLHRYPWLKAQLAKLPRIFLLEPTTYGPVIVTDEQGRIVRSPHNTSGHHPCTITLTKPVGDQLYFGSLENDRIGRPTTPWEKQDEKKPGANAGPS